MASTSAASSRYVGRFAPSPTGVLHAGSLVAALASWLDARAHGGIWKVRIEDLDPPREQPGASDAILNALCRLGLEPDGEVVFQRHRSDAYAAALERLQAAQRVYPCACTRSEIAAALQADGLAPARHQERVYPGTCRAGMPAGRTARAWRLALPNPARVAFVDRWAGPQTCDLNDQCGDFVLRRADGLWAYHLAVVIDDAWQGVTHVVRGDDLLSVTPRQIWLQHQMGLPTPQYMHVPVVRDPGGEKLSKQTGAVGLNLDDPRRCLAAAALHLGLQDPGGHAAALLADLTHQWRARWCADAESVRRSSCRPAGPPPAAQDG